MKRTGAQKVDLTYIDQACDLCGYYQIAVGEEDTLRDVTMSVRNAPGDALTIARRYTLGIALHQPPAKLMSIVETGKDLAGPALVTSFDYQLRTNRGCNGQ
jgi:hypothetical protein